MIGTIGIINNYWIQLKITQINEYLINYDRQQSNQQEIKRSF